MEVEAPMVVKPLELMEILEEVVHKHPLVCKVHCLYLT
jgi:hypothetical protein